MSKNTLFGINLFIISLLAIIIFFAAVSRYVTQHPSPRTVSQVSSFSAMESTTFPIYTLAEQHKFARRQARITRLMKRGVLYVGMSGMRLRRLLGRSDGPNSIKAPPDGIRSYNKDFYAEYIVYYDDNDKVMAILNYRDTDDPDR